MKVIHLSHPIQFNEKEQQIDSHVMAIGDFDGVHLGHQKVIRHAVDWAQYQGIAASVMTFHPHPREVLGNEQYSRTLASLQDRLDRFEQLGVDMVFVVEFHAEFAKLSPEVFLNQYVKQLKARAVVVGFDFKFGNKGAGNAQTLEAWAGGEGILVHIIPAYQLDGEKISSSQIRELIEKGRVKEAKHRLGYYYTIAGKVIHGHARGRTIGFPTANLELNHAYVLPQSGVYAVLVTADEDRRMAGVMNIGVKPTFHSGHDLSIEVHIMDFQGDLYGKTLQVEILEHIRAEQKFPSIEALVEQIKRDSENAKKIAEQV
ncbi:bifunctional riboflavin kinase/FAD synthetase [Marinicrinis lubricantis]|uniref:Riboflavin biosynthesis protein n=1 Tax=Marinicrinis lubricantis TaxID=2086470 RepID=A0ABW1IMD0_9BACL